MPYSKTMIRTLWNLYRANDLYPAEGVKPWSALPANTAVALRTRGAIVNVAHSHFGLTEIGAEAIGVDYDAMIERAHDAALAMNTAFRRCPLADEGCDFTSFGRPATPFGHYREITSDDQITYHVNAAHIPMQDAIFMTHIGHVTDEVREHVRQWLVRERADRAAAAVMDRYDARITDVEQARAEARYEYIERAKTTPGLHAIMDGLDLAKFKRQFCRVCLASSVPAVTLTFDNGERRLHWCAEHIDDAERYRAHSDQATPAASTYAVDVPVDYQRCEKPEPHSAHAWSLLGPAVSHFCGGHKLAETHVALPVLHGPITDDHGAELVDESPSFFAGAAPVRTYADGCWSVGPYPPLQHNLDGFTSGIFTSHTLDASA